MPLITIKYKLPEEREEYELHMQAGKMSIALEEFSREILRGNTKHGVTERFRSLIAEDCGTSSMPTDEQIIDVLEAVKTEFWRLMNENNVEV